LTSAKRYGTNRLTVALLLKAHVDGSAMVHGEARRLGRRALGFPVFRYASPDLDAHEFEELLRARGMEGSAPCPICEGLDWISPPRSYALVEDGDVEHGLTVLPFLCTNCGFVRLHAPKAIDAPKLAGLED
jgi:hypothetical protein